MDVTDIPFNRFVGIRSSERPELGQLVLDASPDHQNHVGTVHAAAQYALAEACSGEYLLSHFRELAAAYVPVVRRAEIKYRKPAQGRIYAQANAATERLEKFRVELETKGRGLLSIDVNVVDANGVAAMKATFEWFAQRMRGFAGDTP